MSDKPTPNFFQENPERVMILLFPLITFVLFIIAAVLWWVITTQLNLPVTS